MTQADIHDRLTELAPELERRHPGLVERLAYRGGLVELGSRIGALRDAVSPDMPLWKG
jgi:hypothetical protein